MNDMIDLNRLTNDVVNDIDGSLEHIFDEDVRDDLIVKAAMYSLMAGGKRFRPCLMYLVSDMIGIERSDVRTFACALEMIHTYSLIHDDLPGMDNDDLRRGKPTCHKAFGEGIAVLAGDLLLNRAMEIMSEKALACDTENRENALYASYMIVSSSGINGMLGGQSLDKASEGQSISVECLRELQDKKTGALIRAALTTPYYLKYGNEDSDLLKDLKSIADHIGLAFQIRDDLLDVTSSPDVLGKSIGKDDRDNKSTFVTLLGEDESEKILDSEIADSINILDRLAQEGYDTESLRQMILFTAERNS